MKLTRTQFRPDGIFGRLYNDNGVPLCYSLEHSFAQLDGSWVPKVAPGTYECVLGEHQLEGMAKPFQTYEITKVPPFEGKPVTGILLHMGNYDSSSSGCILVGRSVVTQENGSQMVTASVATFDDLMESLSGVQSFSLVVVNEPG